VAVSVALVVTEDTVLTGGFFVPGFADDSGFAAMTVVSVLRGLLVDTVLVITVLVVAGFVAVATGCFTVSVAAVVFVLAAAGSFVAVAVAGGFAGVTVLATSVLAGAATTTVVVSGIAGLTTGGRVFTPSVVVCSVLAEVVVVVEAGL
jgi:hypothetical protein